MRRILLALGLCVFVLGGFGIGCGDGESTSPGGTGGMAGSAGSDAGDGGGTGGTDGGQCYTASFVSPKDGAQLNEANDSDNDCSNGFTTDITVAVAAPDGTSVELLSGGASLATASVSGASATFTAVQLDTGVPSTLTLRIDNNPSCDVTATMTVDCNVPACSISKPTLSPTHPKLNGVPVSQGGDMVSAAGAPYQAAFEVTTDIADGQLVSISVDGSTTLTTVAANGGVVQFAGITLSPDGDHTVVAKCTGSNGKVGTSAAKTFPVDSTPPDLTMVGPTDGQFFGPSDDADPGTPGLQFQVCGTTTAADALDLPASLGAGQQNFCAGIGTSSPTCVGATTGGAGTGDGGCVNITCPGGAAFDINVTLTDDAGNPTTATVKGVTCASNLPSVQIIDPVDGTGTDINTHILAASMNTTRVDQNASTPGAQYTVVACTDTQGGSAQLLAGMAGGTLAPLGSAITVATATAADNCPSGLGYVAKFANVTIPKSSENADGTLNAASELRVDVTAPSTAKGSSPPVDVWVDADAPVISAQNPNPLCGKLIQSATDYTQTNFTLNSTVVPVALALTNNGNATNYTGSTLNNGRVNFGDVIFAMGDTDVVATATEPSGNSGALQSPCTVTVGNPPVVTWTSPTTATKLNAATDGNSNVAGWQGTLTVQTDVGGSGGTVQFSTDVGGTVTNLGSPVNINASGVATLAGQTIPEGDPVKIIATTSNITGRGVGTATLTKTVDVSAPGAVTALVATVKDHRQTTFHLAWTAPDDGGKPAYSYDVRVSKSPITAGNFASAASVLYTGTPAAAGQPDGVDVPDQLIETDYYFAVAASDKAGNRSTIATAGPTKATFNTTMLSPGNTDERFGLQIDGSSSINGDAFSDIVVGTANGSKAYAYFGSKTGFKSTPDVTFSGAAGTLYGFSVAVVGDIDGDGLADVAIGSPIARSVYIYKGRSTWPATVSTADYTVTVDDTADTGYTSSGFGFSLARLGDFNGDGFPDFAIGARAYNGFVGSVTIVLGVPSTSTFPSTVTVPQSDGTRTISIHGDPAMASGTFGANVAGLGKFYNSTGNTLIVAAPAAPANGAGSGRVYAFRGQTGGVSGLIDIATADHTEDGAAAASRLGTPLSPLGDMYGTAAPDLGVGASRFPSGTGGLAELHFGTASTGPFAGQTGKYSDSAASSTGDAFGFGILGCGFNGTAVTTSLIGGSEPDVVLAALREAGGASKLYFLSAQDVGAHVGTTADAVGAASVAYSLPNDWRGVSSGSSVIKDLDGDGYGDVAIGEYYYKAPATPYDGRVLVLW